MNWDRFRAPTRADEMAFCAGCGRRRHYEQLDEKGLCAGCRPEADVETPKAEEGNGHFPS